MTDRPNDKQTPELADLISAAEPTGKQKFLNFFGLGYGGNTAVSIVSVKVVRKLMPGLVEKWEQKHAKKYFDRKTQELIAPVADKLDAESKAALEEKIAKDAAIYGKKTVDSRLLCTGGFAMLPFQSAMQVKDYNVNVKPHINEFRESAAKMGMTTTQAETALQSAIDQQRQALRPGDKKGQNILNGALEEPKFSPLGSDAKADLPKWIVGRVIALGAAFSTQTIVDDRFTKPKDAVDHTLSKIVTRIMHPKGYHKKSDLKDTAFEGQEAQTDVPEGVDPKVLDIVRMVTTDAYMTTVAIGAHMLSMNYWDKKAPDMAEKFKSLQQKLSGIGGRASGPSV